MKKYIAVIKNGEIVGYWDKWESSIRRDTISLISDISVQNEYEQVMLFIHHIAHKNEILFPVIVPFDISPGLISDELRAESKILYDQINRKYWPIKS